MDSVVDCRRPDHFESGDYLNWKEILGAGMAGGEQSSLSGRRSLISFLSGWVAPKLRCLSTTTFRPGAAIRADIAMFRFDALPDPQARVVRRSGLF
jgi:hypothetical protein